MNTRTKICLVGSALVLLPVGLVAVPASASAGCTVEALPSPVADSDLAPDLSMASSDPSGHYIVGAGRRLFPNANVHLAMLWTDGELQRLGPDGLRKRSGAVDVNATGVVVGWSEVAEGEFRGWTYADGEYTMLPVPAGAEDAAAVLPSAINANGDIVGHYNYPDHENHALFWPADQPGTVQELAAPTYASAVDISDTGVIVGELNTDTGGVGAGYVWKDPAGEGAELPDPTGDPSGGPLATPSDINGSTAVGFDWSGSSGGGYGGGVVWDLDTGSAEASPEPLTAVNSAGDVLTMGGFDRPDSKLIRADGTEVELPVYQGGHMSGKVLFDQDAPLTAAGNVEDEDLVVPVVWRGC